MSQFYLCRLCLIAGHDVRVSEQCRGGCRGVEIAPVSVTRFIYYRGLVIDPTTVAMRNVPASLFR
jgi:hypothetical protein